MPPRSDHCKLAYAVLLERTAQYPPPAVIEKAAVPATSWSPVMQLPHWLILAGCLLVLGGVLGLLLTRKPGATERSAPGLFDGDNDGDQLEEPSGSAQ